MYPDKNFDPAFAFHALAIQKNEEWNRETAIRKDQSEVDALVTVGAGAARYMRGVAPDLLARFDFRDADLAAAIAGWILAQPRR